MRELIVATRNRKKFEEIKALLSEVRLKVTSLNDYSNVPAIEEDGKTFEENAFKKAATIALWSKKLTMGEDSGLEVKALDNQPGIYSARFASPRATDKKNNAKLLRLLKNVPMSQRRACYRCAVAVVDGEKIVGVLNGSCRGLISQTPRGSNGFGYDPLFLIPSRQKTFGELPPQVKATLSHRSRALTKFKKLIEKYFEGRLR